MFCAHLSLRSYNGCMRILIANDDGYLAPGIEALVKACEGLGVVDVFAPERNASGTSNALTLHQPLSLHTAANGFRYVTGTPSDSVHLALTAGIVPKPDLVLSGVNRGHNVAEDVVYSGTAGAAMEGGLNQVRSIALSQQSQWSSRRGSGLLVNPVAPLRHTWMYDRFGLHDLRFGADRAPGSADRGGVRRAGFDEG